MDDRVQIEKKTALKARLGRSPDRADAVVMAFSGVDEPANTPTVHMVHI